MIIIGEISGIKNLVLPPIYIYLKKRIELIGEIIPLNLNLLTNKEQSLGK